MPRKDQPIHRQSSPEYLPCTDVSISSRPVTFQSLHQEVLPHSRQNGSETQRRKGTIVSLRVRAVSFPTHILPIRDAESTNLELLNSAHSPHILLIRLSKSWPCWISLGVDVVPSFSIVNAVEGVFLPRDITQG